MALLRVRGHDVFPELATLAETSRSDTRLREQLLAWIDREERYDAYVQAIVAAAPPLTVAQRTAIRLPAHTPGQAEALMREWLRALQEATARIRAARTDGD